MNDKALNALIRSTLLAAIATDPDLSGAGVVAVKRAFQQSQQGADSAASVYFFKVGDHRYGHVSRKDVLNVGGTAFDHTESQQYETTYQLMARVPQDPADADGLTESDVLNIVSGIMQSDRTLAAFRAAGVGVERVTEVRNPYIVDESDKYAASPSFDIVLTHKRITVSAQPAVTTYEAKIVRT